MINNNKHKLPKAINKYYFSVVISAFVFVYDKTLLFSKNRLTNQSQKHGLEYYLQVSDILSSHL